MRVSGEGMVNDGIHSGDLLIVDRSLQPSNGRLVVAAVDGVLTIRRIQQRHGQWQLIFLLPRPNSSFVVSTALI